VILPAVGHDDFHAFIGEHLGDAETDATAAAGDERDLAAQVFHGFPPRRQATAANGVRPFLRNHDVGALVLPAGMFGMIEASMTRSACTPRTRNSVSTTAPRRVPCPCGTCPPGAA
jgi:hypothetical protein